MCNSLLLYFNSIFQLALPFIVLKKHLWLQKLVVNFNLSAVNLLAQGHISIQINKSSNMFILFLLTKIVDKSKIFAPIMASLRYLENNFILQDIFALNFLYSFNFHHCYIFFNSDHILPFKISQQNLNSTLLCPTANKRLKRLFLSRQDHPLIRKGLISPRFMNLTWLNKTCRYIIPEHLCCFYEGFTTNKNQKNIFDNK